MAPPQRAPGPESTWIDAWRKSRSGLATSTLTSPLPPAGNEPPESGRLTNRRPAGPTLQVTPSKVTTLTVAGTLKTTDIGPNNALALAFRMLTLPMKVPVDRFSLTPLAL